MPHIKTKLPGPKAKKIIARDHKTISSCYNPRPYPLVVDYAKGLVLTDVDGNKFLDFTAGIAVCSTGHAHPKVVAAIQKQASKFLHMCGADFYYENQVELSERLARLAPGNFKKQVFFTNSGAEAVEAALKCARYTTKRKKILAFYGAFHGRTMGALSLTNSKAIQRKHFGPFVPEVVHAPYGDIDFIENKLFKNLVDPSELAAVFVEPIQGEGGYIVPPKGFLKKLRALATRHKFLFICDEIQAGMGRTGKMFAIEHENVVPDMVLLAKGIASGMPIGALIANAKYMTWVPGAHGSTFGGNPVSCAAAIETLNLIEKSFMANAKKQGDELRKHLDQMAHDFKSVQEVRGRGLMQAIEIGNAKKRDAIAEACFEKGLLLLGCGASAIRFSPALNVSKSEVLTAVKILREVLNQF